MATTERVSRKELLKPDEFQSTFARFLAWAQRNQTTVLAGVVGILVAVALGFALTWYMGYRRQASFEAYGLLQEAIDKAQTSGAEADLRAVAERAENGSLDGPARALAAYRLGAFYADRGELAPAARYLSEAVEAAGPNLAAARYRLAGVLEAQGDAAGAAREYRLAADAARGFVQEDALYDLGRLRERQGETAAAEEIWREFAKRYPDSPRAADVNEKVASATGG